MYTIEPLQKSINGCETLIVHIKNKKASESLNLHPKADGQLGSIGAPMPGEVINITVNVGDKVKEGQTIATLRYVFEI